MAQVGSFEDYMKTSVLDVSQSSKPQAKAKQVEPENFNLNPVMTFTGSKLWLDLNLDSSYYQLEKAHDVCLKFCYDTNLKRHIQQLKEDTERASSMACQNNCLNKIFRASELVGKALQQHPLTVQNNSEFRGLEQQVAQFNQEVIHGQKNYSF